MRIFHPRPELGRQSMFDVEFIDGVANVESLHPERELAFIQHGYRIEPDVEVEAPYQEGLGEEIVDLNSLSVPQLRDIAETEGVDLPSKARKPEIVKILSELPAEPIPGATHNDDGTWTIEGLTEAGRQLASEREDLIASGVDPAELAVPLHPEAAED